MSTPRNLFITGNFSFGNKWYLTDEFNVCPFEEAEIIFAWVTDLADEDVMYFVYEAAKHHKKIFLASPQHFPQLDDFFATCHYYSDQTDPVEAFRFFTMTTHILGLIGSNCESPIERMFWDEICWIFRGIIPQVKTGKYRLDFASEDLKVAIEIDGHDYHKTKDQRTKDAERQRSLEKDGWRVIRFTGTEVFNNPRKCAVDTVVLICQWLLINNQGLLTE